MIALPSGAFERTPVKSPSCNRLRQASYCGMRCLRVAAMCSSLLLLEISSSHATMMSCTDADSHRGPQWDINELCRRNQWTCVADLTAATPCRIRPNLNIDWVSHSYNLVEDLAKACPNYSWTEIRGVHVFAPTNTKDSKLNVLVGPVNENTPPWNLLQELFNSAGLASLPHGIDCAGGNVAESLSTLRMMSFVSSLKSHHPEFVDSRLHGISNFAGRSFGMALLRPVRSSDLHSGWSSATASARKWTAIRGSTTMTI